MQNSLGPNNFQENNQKSLYNYNNQNGYINPAGYDQKSKNSSKLLIGLVSILSIIVIVLCILLIVIINNKGDSISSRSDSNRQTSKASAEDKDVQMDVKDEEPDKYSDEDSDDSIDEESDKESDKDSNNKDDESSGNSKKSDELIKVGIINNDPNESAYRTANDVDLKNTFTKENGYDASFAYSLRADEQIAAAQLFIDDGVDYLLISAADVSGWDDVLQDAKDAGIKVIFFDRYIDADSSLYETLIVSDMNLEGDIAANWLKDQNLSEYKIIHLQGVLGSTAQQGRSGGLDTMASQEGWTIVTQQSAEWDAQKAKEIVSSVIDSGETFNVIYAENDDMARGAVEALDEANISHGFGGDVIIIGFDCNKWALEEVLAGNWSCDIQCSPFQASYIDEAIRTLESGNPVPKETIIDEKYFDYNNITQEDVEKYGL